MVVRSAVTRGGDSAIFFYCMDGFFFSKSAKCDNRDCAKIEPVRTVRAGAEIKIDFS